MVRNFKILTYQDSMYWPDLEKIPTVLLLATDRALELMEAEKIVEYIINQQCGWLMTWGRYAENWNDYLDELLEKNQQLSTITTCHQDESLKEVIFFLTKSTYPDEKKMLCTLILDENFALRNKLKSEIAKLCD